MNEEKQNGGMMNTDAAQQYSGDYRKLAQWLQQVLQEPEPEDQLLSPIEENTNQLELILNTNYHPTFYQQIPDFIMALLNDDAQATIHYAPLLFHMVECHTCHDAYLDLYSAMRAAVTPQDVRPILSQGTRTLAAVPHRMLGHLCRSLISQAEALLRQSRHDHQDREAAARSLLQLALRVSAPINQSSIRREALRDLVRVATLFDGVSVADDDDPRVSKYTAVLASAGGMKRGKTLRRSTANPLAPKQEDAVIHLQSQSLQGSIVQNGEVLELHLRDLAPALRGNFVNVSVLLGSLLEPVRWIGGNPQAIRSALPVDERGTLVTPVGTTELQLSNLEERNLLEAMFMLLEVRAVDQAH